MWDLELQQRTSLSEKKTNKQTKKANKKADENLQCIHLVLSNTE